MGQEAEVRGRGPGEEDVVSRVVIGPEEPSEESAPSLVEALGREESRVSMPGEETAGSVARRSQEGPE